MTLWYHHCSHLTTGDVVKARIMTLGDSRKYYLSTSEVSVHSIDHTHMHSHHLPGTGGPRSVLEQELEW